MANSVLWSLVALPSLWWVLHRDGPLLAWTATAVLAVLPAGVWMSQEVRPYAWLTVLLIAAYGRPGDVVYAPQASMFDGIAWYLAGPDWGSPLAVANPPSPPWQSV